MRRSGGKHDAVRMSITIGLSGDITAFDPHYHNVGPNNSAAAHVFERLVAMDEQQRLKPGLAIAGNR